MDLFKKLEKAEVYKVLFESATEGLVVVNDRGEIVLLNQRATALFGYAENELLGKRIEVLLPKQLRHKHEGHHAQYMKQPSKRMMGMGRDLKGRKKNGEEFYVEVSLNHFKLEGKTYVMSLITDVTDRKKAEFEIQQLNVELEGKVQQRTKELEQSQRLYQLIARNFPNGTINVFDRALNYVFVEGQELFNLGIDNDKLIGSNYLSRLDKAVAEEIQPKIQAVFNGKGQTFEIKVNDQFYEINAVPLVESEGNVEQILLVEKNITDLKKAELDVLEALDKEKKLNEIKSRFVSMASHEFRTPLSTILSSASLIGKYTTTEQETKRAKHVGRIKSSVDNLTGILNDFLSLSKLEEGKVDLKTTDVEIGSFIRGVVEDLALGTEEVAVEHIHEGEQVCQTDANILRNILFNLLSNAVKYSYAGSVVQVKTQCDAQQIKLGVINQGEGIPFEEQHQVFDRFFRSKDVMNIQGTGLGLNIVKRYVGLLGGEISFESIPKQQTSFWVELPNQTKP